MDDLLREFLTETSESLDTVDNQLVRFEQDPSNAKILDNIFRLVHTIKGTCGFLGLPRLEALAHAGETLMGKFRDGMPVTAEAVTLILSSIDRIKEILAGLEATEAEPEGTDEDLIDKLHAMVEGGASCRGRSGRSKLAPAPVVAAPPAAARGDARARWSSRCWSAVASRRSLARRTRARLPRDRDRSRRPRRQRRSPSRTGRARAEAGSRAASRARRKQAKPAKKAAAAETATSRKPTRSPTSRSASTWTRWNI